MTQTRRPNQNRRSAPRKAEDQNPGSISAPMNPETHQEQEANQPPVERIGSILKRAREQRGDDLQQIADYLCIRRGFLEALEASRYDELPADAYVIGFLRSYANYLGFDGKQAIDHYRNEMSGRRKKPTLLLPTPIAEGQTPSAIILIGCAVGALLIYILWYTFSSSDRTAVTTPPPLPAATSTATSDSSTPSSAQTAPAPAETSETAVAKITDTQPSIAAPAATAVSETSAPESTAKAVPPPGGARLSIRAEQSSWILISNGKGRTIFDEVMKPGEVYSVPDQPGLLLTTGNGGGIVLTLDGTALPKLSNGSSHVMRNISLDPARLKALPPVPEN